MKEILKKTFFVSAGAQKWWETVDSGPTLSQYVQNTENTFSVKFIFTWSIFLLLSTSKKSKTISLKVFKIMAF